MIHKSFYWITAIIMNRKMHSVQSPCLTEIICMIHCLEESHKDCMAPPFILNLNLAFFFKKYIIAYRHNIRNSGSEFLLLNPHYISIIIHKFQLKKPFLWNSNLSLLHVLPVFFLILKKKKIKKNQFSLAGKKSVMYTYGKFAKAHIFLNFNV